MILIEPMIFFNKDDNEVWKPLVYKGIPLGEYLISNFGNIYDLKLAKYTKLEHRSDGYIAVTLRHTNEVPIGRFLVHRLVAANFTAYKLEEQNQVNHKDGHKNHNHDINLEWMTAKENTNHAFETGLAKNNIGEASHLSKLTNAQVETICDMLSKGMRYKDILVSIGLDITDNNLDTIGCIYRGISWKNISKNYTFPEYDDRFRVNSKETIENICANIDLGYDNKTVYEKVFGVELKRSRDDKQNYELIRLIRNGKVFTDISSKYNFLSK